jgi:chromosome segregation ATPase
MDEQPSPEMLHQLKELQLKVKQKDRQLKAMAAELNTQQSKLAEYQGQYEVLNKQLSDARDMQYSQKKVYNRLKDRMQRSMQTTEAGGTERSGEDTFTGDQAMPTLPSGLK